MAHLGEGERHGALPRADVIEIPPDGRQIPLSTRIGESANCNAGW